MTKEELKALPHLALIDEQPSFLHIETEDGWWLYDGESTTNIAYFPIRDTYANYEVIDHEVEPTQENE